MIEMLTEGIAWFKASGLAQAKLTIPMIETMFLFGALTVCLLFRFCKTGLIIAYLFVYRWGWSLRVQELAIDPGLQNVFMTAYIVFGVLVFTFAIVSMAHGDRTGE